MQIIILCNMQLGCTYNNNYYSEALACQFMHNCNFYRGKAITCTIEHEILDKNSVRASLDGWELMRQHKKGRRKWQIKGACTWREMIEEEGYIRGVSRIFQGGFSLRNFC